MPTEFPDRPLEDHGIVGDMRTLAVIANDGSIDWMCWPRFDSPSIFGALLDADGGRWSIDVPDCVPSRRQVYLSSTNVLLTRYHTPTALVEVEDLMTTGFDERHLVRTIHCRRGSVDISSRMALRPDYGRGHTEVEVQADGTAALTLTTGDADTTDDADEPIHLVASGDASWECDDTGDLHTACSLAEGETIHLILGESSLDRDDATARHSATASFWREWSAQTTYAGRWRESVERSSLVLKMLTHEPSGGIIAAGTTSLPEVVGGERNWDYRYVWIRDAAFTVYAFIALGHLDEAAAFTAWLVARMETCDENASNDDPLLAPLYTLDGDAGLDEIELDHWSGYDGSRPVRVGNAAGRQLQLDIYGELIDAIYLADKYGDGISIDTWRHVGTIIDWLDTNWERPDHGMWEPRDGTQRHTSSLLMMWVAVERSIRMARRRGRPAPLDRWCALRDRMHDVLIERGYDSEAGAFTQALDGSALDASILLAPLVKFISPSDPRWTSTLDAIAADLAHGPLVDRYDLAETDDGLAGDEGSFTMCSFWYVEALARSGRVDEARELFDRLLSYAGPTGILSEEIGADGRMLGNLPQAFTHLSLISAALALDQALDRT